MQKHVSGPAKRDPATNPILPQFTKNSSYLRLARGNPQIRGRRLAGQSCNRVGHEPSPLAVQHVTGASGIRFWGTSHVLGPQGEVLAQAGTDASQLLIAQVDLARSENVRRIWPFLRDRRIDSYGDLLKRYRD